MSNQVFVYLSNRISHRIIINCEPPIALCKPKAAVQSPLLLGKEHDAAFFFFLLSSEFFQGMPFQVLPLFLLGSLAIVDALVHGKLPAIFQFNCLM